MTTTYRYTVRWVQEGLSDTFAETLRWEETELLTRSQAEHEADAHIHGPDGSLHPSIGYRILSVQVELLTAETVSLADETTRPDHCADAKQGQEWPREDKSARVSLWRAGSTDGAARGLEKARAGEAFPGSCRLSCTEVSTRPCLTTRGSQCTLRLGLLSTPTLGQDALGGGLLKDLQNDGHEFRQDAGQQRRTQAKSLGLLERLLECLRVLLSTGNARERLLNLLEALLTGLRLLAALLSLWHDCFSFASVPSVPCRHHAGLSTSYSSPLTG